MEPSVKVHAVLYIPGYIGFLHVKQWSWLVVTELNAVDVI